MTDPTQETTMTTTITDAMVEAGAKEIERYFGPLVRHHDIAAGVILAALRAMPAAAPSPHVNRPAYDAGYERGVRDQIHAQATLAAAPTTPEPDGLAERIDRLAEAIASQAQVGMEMQNDDAELYRRIRAHDAALAELREQVGQALDWQWEYTRHCLPSRIEQTEKFAGVPDIFSTAPPAVPDAGEDDERIELAQFAEHVTRNCETNDDWLRAGQRIIDGVAGRILTPAPPPLVVTDGFVNSISDKYGIGEPWICGILNDAARHWNAARVPAGDNQGDRPDVGGE